ncbi:HEXXH motif-containing putative peptide modification protein [Streptomyces misionensis]|uniref:aKG-HExxH-type peptide beta-hydroxylase n=1 Tax=Streptomyces misionensis TaxID=67331 RepID=UPI0036B2013C
MSPAVVGSTSIAARAVQGGVSVGSVAGDVHFTYEGMPPDHGHTGLALSAVSMPLAVPQRRVPQDRLRGREALVDGLTRVLSQRASGADGVCLLAGMGGCGKTTVALEVAHRLIGVRRQVWWVPGAESEGLSAALHSVAYAAGAVPSDFVGMHPADVLWRRLEALTTPWLLVLDNVDDPAVLAAAPSRTLEGRGWLRPPPHLNGAVLVTSREARTERWGSWVTSFDIEPLSSGDGAQVLRDLAPDAGSERDAQELAEYLGGLPLALDLAGTYLARIAHDPWPSPSAPSTFAAYRHSLGERLEDMASDPDTDLAPAERSRRAIVSTWELSLDLLDRQGADLARPLLRLLSAFGPAPIPYQDLLNLNLLAGSGLFPDLTFSRLQEALRSLTGLKLVNVETTSDTRDGGGDDPRRWITIHPMVRAASRAHPAFTKQTSSMLRLVSGLLHEFTSPWDVADPAQWPKWRAIAAHGSAALPLLHALERGDGTATADLVVTATETAVRTALYHLHVGMFGESVSQLRAARDARVRLLGAEDPATIGAGLALAWALRSAGDLVESDKLYRQLATVCERSLPADHPYLQSVRTGRARTLGQLGRYEDAEAELRAALVLRQRDPKAGSRSILRIRSDLGRMAYNQGRLEEAVTELREVRRLTRALARQGELDSLEVGPSLVRALREAGHAEEAETVAEEVLEEHRAVLPPDHRAVLIARYERARLLRDHEWDRGLLEQARDDFADIWKAARHRLGPDHPDTIATQHELATVWHLLGHPDRAAEHFLAALEAGRRRLGENHPNVTVCARNLAIVLTELELAPESRPDSGSYEAAVTPAAGDGHNQPTNAPSPQGDSPVRESRRNQFPPLPDLPDLAGLSLEDALAPERDDSASSPALKRLLDRFARADRTTASYSADGGGPAYSSGSSTPRTPPSAEPRRPAPTYRPNTAPDAEADPFRRAEPNAPTSADADIQALARGEDDRHVVKRLRAQQRGIRLLALREILDRTTAGQAGRTDESLSAHQVRGTMAQAARADLEAVTTVLLHPPVGRWMSRTLRALRNHPDAPSVRPLPAELLHLHSVVAAMAIRAGIPFHLLLVPRDGFVFLPTLGAADLRTAGDSTAFVYGRDDSFTFSCGALTVPVSEGAAHPAWHPAHRLRTPVGTGRFDFVLDDMDPDRDSSGPLEPSFLTPAEVANWARLTRDAANLLARADLRQAEALAEALTALTPRPAEPGGVVHSASSGDSFGGLMASMPPDGTELAVTLVHEFRHMKLNAVLDRLELHEELDEAADAAYYAPWRDDPRPLSGLFQGVFAFVGVVEFWRKLTFVAEGEELRRAQFQLLYWSAQTADAFTELQSSPRLTEAGRNFAALMGDTVATWSENAAAVPESIAMLAMEAVVAHRVRWRLHHLRPEPAAITALADAWLSDAPYPPRQSVTTALCPDPAIASSTAYTALLCRAAATLSEPDRPSVLRLRDQIVRRPERKEPWVGLALALRQAAATATAEQPGTPAAARALTHRPETVEAVRARLAAVTAVPPDPVALAAWLGTMDGMAQLPTLPQMGRRISD